MATTSTSFLGSIRGRLIVGIAALALIPLIMLAVVLGYYASRQSTLSLNQRANDQMASIRAGKQEEIRAYFGNVANLMRTVANTAEVRQALRDSAETQPQMVAGVDLEQARTALTDYYRNDFGPQFSARNPGQRADISAMVATLPPQALAAQYAYIADNPNPLGKKGSLDQADDGSAYSAVHARIHGYARRAVQDYGLYDFFLVDAQTGVVVYTYFKELDFATSLRDGIWSQSGLGQAYRNAMASKTADAVLITDYAPYRPSYDDQASFVSTPIIEDGRTIGVFVVQLPIDRVNQIMTFNDKWKEVGLGESGETYLVGQDKTPRSVSRFMKENSAGFVDMMRGLKTPQSKLASMDSRDSNVGLMTVDTRGVQSALAGNTGTAVYRDYRGINVLGSYAPIDVLGLRWAILSEIDESESNAPVAALQRGIAFAGLGTLVLVGLIALFSGLRLARSINVPLAQVQDTVLKVGGGDLDARTGLKTTDEIGQLAQAFDGLLDDKVAELARAQKENEELNNSVIEIMTSVAQLAQRDLNVKVPVSEDVTGAVSDAINMMTTSTARALKEVNAISAQVSDSSNKVKQRADNVLKLADEASNQANAASTELSTTANALRQIGEQAQGAGREAERALVTTNEAMAVVRATVEGITNSRDQIRETEKRVKRLAERSQEISSAVVIIGQIAERTSVLALNASMQAVAAGEAGRGFAVVAEEVKRLAENAREATQQIAGLVSAIQSDTTETLQAMNGTISQVVDITRLADRAGVQMNDNREATEALVNSVRNISVATQAQGDASQRLLARAYDLISASQNTLEEIEQQRGDTQTLTESASALVRTVSEFRLPG
ncbi:MAG: methyl-accepting chemotaxis protein [Pseudomonadota bacterium]